LQAAELEALELQLIKDLEMIQKVEQKGIDPEFSFMIRMRSIPNNGSTFIHRQTR